MGGVLCLFSLSLKAEPPLMISSFKMVTHAVAQEGRAKPAAAAALAAAVPFI
jgi:hypothetical protein